MEQAGLFDKFMASAQPEGQDIRVMDKDGSVLWEETDCTHMDRPEVCAPTLPPLCLVVPCHGPYPTNTRNKRTENKRKGREKKEKKRTEKNRKAPQVL